MVIPFAERHNPIPVARLSETTTLWGDKSTSSYKLIKNEATESHIALLLQTWDNATATQGKLDTFQPNTVRGGHAVAIVGYSADKRFIIRNSWGTAWGDKGYGYASEAYITAAFFNESYGITL